MSKSIFESIIEAKFVANEAQVEELAALVASGTQGAGTYLRVIVAHTKQQLTGSRKPTKGAVLKFVKAIHDRLYAAVLKGVADESVSAIERNRRATFARSAVSTLRQFITRGGDVRKLDPADTTKVKLRNYGRRVPKGTRAHRSLQRAADAVLRAATVLARKSPEDARKRLEALRANIEKALHSLGGEKPVKRTGKRLRRVAPSPGSRNNGHRGGLSQPSAMH